jgi:arabinogalactan endo-1,4-beta-galactosidase
MNRILIYFLSVLIIAVACKKDNSQKTDSNHHNGHTKEIKKYSFQEFCMGADLSFVNQVEDHGGIYRDSAEVRDPFRIMNDHGANLVRVRLWHHPVWIRDAYNDPGMQLYSDLYDVEKTVRRAKEKGMYVNLDIHYSDFWADPGRQDPPAAWSQITDLDVLKDSVYNYTSFVLQYLDNKGLMPEMVQIGNETNCGMLCTNTGADFPKLNGCNSYWAALGEVFNAAIAAVRSLNHNTLIALHVADPKNIVWWYDHMITNGQVTDFDIVGFSYYPQWHTTISFDDLQALVTSLKAKYQRKVMILETGYPWTVNNADNYANMLGGQASLPGFPFTKEGQYNFLVELTQRMINAGASGVMYWEPAWISSQMKDPWGTGSSYDNCTFFDFQGNTIKGIDFMNYQYDF